MTIPGRRPPRSKLPFVGKLPDEDVERLVAEAQASPPVPGMPPTPMGGWISPDGKHYACHDDIHWETALKIVVHLGLRRDKDPQEVLEDRGWLHVMDAGNSYGHIEQRDAYTQGQLDCLFDLSEAHPSMAAKLHDVLDQETEYARWKAEKD